MHAGTWARATLIASGGDRSKGQLGVAPAVERDAVPGAEPGGEQRVGGRPSGVGQEEKDTGGQGKGAQVDRGLAYRSRGRTVSAPVQGVRSPNPRPRWAAERQSCPGPSAALEEAENCSELAAGRVAYVRRPERGGRDKDAQVVVLEAGPGPEPRARRPRPGHRWSTSSDLGNRAPELSRSGQKRLLRTGPATRCCIRVLD